MLAAQHRERVVELCLALSRRGFFAATGGNLALRIDHQHIAVTPSATDYFAMRAEDVCVLRLDDLTRIEGERSPSVETALHANLFKSRVDAHCSIHTHQPVASACALIGKTLQVAHPQSRRILGSQIPMIGYMPSGSSFLANKVSKALKPGINAYFMRNHGVLCCGPTVEEAMLVVEELERFCADFLADRIRVRAATHPSQTPALNRLLALLEQS
jgi:L-fuculose-phosphate aldolase